MHVEPTRFCSGLLVGLVVAAVGCSKSPEGSPGQTGGTGSGGVSASGGKIGSGGSNASGGATGGQNSGGNAGASASGAGGSTGRGGATGLGGSSNGSGGQVTGGSAADLVMGGRAAGGSAVSAGGSAGAGGGAAGAVPAGGGQGAGGQITGGTTSAGGAATGGSGMGGKASGGAAGNGGSMAGGAVGVGGSAAGGSSGSGGTTGTYHPCPTDGTACKIMPFGDSITDGYNGDTQGGYRVELFRLAHSAGKNITFVGSGSNGPATVDSVAFPPHHEGHSGWTIYPETSGRYRDGISYCLSANTNSKCLASNSVMREYKPDIVLLMIGTNDCIDSYDMANAPTRLGTLIDTIYDQLPNVLIVVAQPIPSSGLASKNYDTNLSDRIKTYDDAIPSVVKARKDKGKNIMIVDMFTPFNPNKTTLLEDEWHPTVAGYVLIATQWWEKALKSLL